MGETDLDQLHRRIAVLEAENERLQARLCEQDGAPGRIATETARSTPVGRDELFTAIEKTRMPMILTDPNQPDNPIIFVNRAFQELSGYDSGELVGRNCRFLQGPDTNPAHVAQIRQALADNTDIAIEILNHRRDGSTFANELYISPVFDRDGHLLYHFGSQLDITGYSKARRRVEAAERQLRAIFDSAIEIAIVATDRSGRVTDWNIGAEQVLGWSTEEMLGETTERFFTPEDRATDRMDVEMRLALKDGRASDERWHLRRDDSRFWASGEMMPLRDESGGHIGFLKVLRDRTAQHEAGTALREQEARLRLATISARLGTFDYRIQTGELTWDDRCRELFGLPPGVPVSYEGSFLAGLHPEDRAQAAETVERSIEPRGSGHFAADYRTIGLQDGIERWVSANGETLFENGMPTRLIGTVLDITERKRAEAALRASEALVRENAERVQLALAAGAIIGTWHWDLPTDRFTVDEGFARSFGLDPALGREGIPLAQIVATVHPDDQAGLSTAINEAIARSGSYAHQYRVRRADGKYHWIEANGRVEHAPDGTPQNFPGVLLDVDQRRAVEAERDRVTAELRALTDTLEQRVTERTAELMHAEEALRQSQKMEAVGQLTGGLAHDFNNLLTGVTGSLELLQKRIAQGRIKDVDRYVIAAQGAAKRAAALTHRLLAFSRRQTLDPKPTDVNRLISGMEEMVRRTVGPEIAVDTVGSADLWATLVDPGQLENALLNLCINARDAMPDGGRITVETANQYLDQRFGRERDMEPGGYVSLCVTDNGTGMPPEVAAKALDPFFTTKPIGQGTGLGLSMIYGFTKQSGGQVRIHSEMGKGTTVCLYLPRHLGDAEAAELMPTLTDAPRAEAGQTVLVVDDEPTVRMLVTDVLEDLGYTAIEAADGASGLKVLRSDVRIDLLVTDVGLPGGMNGRQMADAARMARPELKVLFITGYAENALLSHGHLDPGMHVLIKPFAMETLASRIKELLSA